ncbi:hypothetical protein [Nocardia sp. BMG51109]|uniref:hypothetical protein n=1 Tax=Nocardia sp. BMG51109 TaxID=1056816 RepID=UPI00046654DF|nr:hypothetical protein [Nocardia sp. BMG51109]
MQMKSVRGAVVTVAAGAAVFGAPVAAQAAPLRLEPAPAVPQEAPAGQAAPVLALWDPQTGSASLSSNVNARGLCLLQSVSAQNELDCLNGGE